MYTHSYISQSKSTMEYPTDALQAVPDVTHTSHFYHAESFWLGPSWCFALTLQIHVDSKELWHCASRSAFPQPSSSAQPVWGRYSLESTGRHPQVCNHSALSWLLPTSAEPQQNKRIRVQNVKALLSLTLSHEVLQEKGTDPVWRMSSSWSFTAILAHK